MRINSFDEWSPLREVIVGSGINLAQHDLELSFKLFFHDEAYSSFYYPKYRSGRTRSNDSHKPKKRYVEELNEDVELFADTLTQLSVRVHRPVQLSSPLTFTTPSFTATRTPPLNVRDQLIIFGDEVIETPPQVRARYFENDLLKPVLYDYFRQGSRWTTMPRPIMTDRSFDTAWVSGRNTPAAEDIVNPKASPLDTGFEIMIDAAQCIRFGRDVIVNVATRNHELGLEWLRRHLEGRFRLHAVERLSGNHIDSLVLPLRPGTLLLRNESVADYLPEQLQRWDRIIAPEPSSNNFPDYDDDDLIITTPYIDLNVLSVDEETVVVNSLSPELMRTLEAAGFTVVPVRHRHRRLFGGGFHCFTVDTVRESEPEDFWALSGRWWRLCPVRGSPGAGVPGREAFRCRAGEGFPAVAAAFAEAGGEPGEEVQAGHLGGDGPGHGGVPVPGTAGVFPGHDGAADHPLSGIVIEAGHRAVAVRGGAM
jgi:glycine amidinotransferase